MADINLITYLNPSRPYQRSVSSSLSIDFSTVSASSVTISGNPTQDTDAATVKYIKVNSIVKPGVKIAVDTEVNLGTPGGTLDGYNLLPNDTILLLNQSLPSLNGIWVWNGPISPMTRPTEFEVASAQVAGTRVPVLGGSYINTDFVLSTNIVVNTDPAIFTALSAGANSQLSNLTVTAVNVDLNPGTDNTKKLGTSDLRWMEIHGVLVSANSIKIVNPDGNYTNISLAATHTDHSYILPATQGAADSVLTNDGSGNLTWSVPDPIPEAEYLSFTLFQSDIDNNYIGLPHSISQVDSIQVVVSGVLQRPGIDYTWEGTLNLIYFGVAGGLGPTDSDLDPATGVAALTAGDVIEVYYNR